MHLFHIRYKNLDKVYLFVSCLFMAVGTVLGWGGGQKFFISHLHVKRIHFCSLVYLWFPKSTEISVYFSLIYIHLLYVTFLYFFWLAKYWGRGPPCSYGHVVWLMGLYVASTQLWSYRAGARLQHGSNCAMPRHGHETYHPNRSYYTDSGVVCRCDFR